MGIADDQKRENKEHIKDIDARLKRVDRHLEHAKKQAEGVRPLPGLHVPPQPQAGHLTSD